MKVWITKYALTKGILTGEGRKTHTSSMIAVNGSRYENCFHGKDWHLSEASARARVTEMIEAKVVSLNKAIAKLHTLRIKPIKVTEISEGLP